MRTSRIAHDTAKVLRPGAAQSSSRRQTRAFAKALGEYAAASTDERANAATKTTEDTSVQAEDASDLSDSISSTNGSSSEVAKTDKQSLSSRKRKRGTDTPLTRDSSATKTTTAAARYTKTTTRRNVTLKTEDVDRVDDKKVSRPRTPKVKRQPARKTVTADGEVEIHPPLHWRETYDTMKAMRHRITAPVDTMGCERLADPNATPQDQRFQTLVSLMLSSQTRDTTTSATIRQLQTSLAPKGGLTIANIHALPAAELNTLINPVGFHNTKTRHLKAVAEILLEPPYNGDIPDTLEGLIALPGVGPKMAYLCLAAAWGRVEGIGVDVHVHRITNLWGWHSPTGGSRKTKGPEETRLALQGWLPHELWHEINHLLVGFGQTVCAPQRPRCEECDVGAKGLCPAMSRSARAAVGKKSKGEEVAAKGEGVEVLEQVKAEPGETEDVKATAVDVATIGDVEDLLTGTSAVKEEHRGQNRRSVNS